MNGDSLVTPLDALLVINFLNGNRAAAAVRPDVNGDGVVTPLDVLLVVNHLNSPSPAAAEGEGFQRRRSRWPSCGDVARHRRVRVGDGAGRSRLPSGTLPPAARTAAESPAVDSAFAELDDVLTDIAADVLEGWTATGSV